MKTDLEVEREELARAEREVRELRARPHGFTPLAGLTRHKLMAEADKDGIGMMIFAGASVAALLIIGLAIWLGPVLASGMIWLGMAVLGLGLLGFIAWQLRRK